MTDRCEPPEHLRGVDGWHWVRCGYDGRSFIARWSAAPHSGLEPLWARYGESATPVWAAAHWDWRYLAPVATPEEVEALRAERDEAWKFQGEAHRLRTGNKLLADTVRAWGWENRKQESNGELIGRALHEMHAEITTLRARVETLEAALRKIANSGIETFAINVIGGDDISVEGSNRGAQQRAVACIMATARAALEGKP